MRNIETKPIPLRSKGLAGDLKRLAQPTDSFLIENKGLKRAVLYSTASRLGIRIRTQVETGGLRVWRNFEKDRTISQYVSTANERLEQIAHNQPVVTVDESVDWGA
jgi:hypothetical protein